MRVEYEEKRDEKEMRSRWKNVPKKGATGSKKVHQLGHLLSIGNSRHNYKNIS